MSIIWWQVGFMDNGRIKALDIECFINGGCTLDDSELVRISETSAILVCEQSADSVWVFVEPFLQILTSFHKQFNTVIDF